MKKAPLHVVKRQPFGPAGPKFHVWICDARLKGAEFQNRRQEHLSAVVHPSTKYVGKWQLSFFDSRVGATGDIQLKSCQEAVSELPPRQWRLRDLKPRR